MQPDGPPSNVDLIAGVTKGTISLSFDGIKELVFRFRNKSLLFIENREIIESVIKQRKTSEWKIISQYVQNPKLRILAQMGLALRKHEEHEDMVRNLKGKIRHVYDLEGLHIAEAVQNDILTTFIMSDIPSGITPQELTNRIENLLNNVDKYTVFVSPRDKVKVLIAKIKSKIEANSPDDLILYGMKGAKDNIKSVISKIENDDFMNDYSIHITCETELRMIVIISKTV